MNPSLFFVFISAALTAYALFRLVAAFLESEDDQIRRELLDDELREIERLAARKSVLLQTLRDIEFDHETGKLSDEDYERLRAEYERRAVEVISELDGIRGGPEFDEEIDAEVEARLAGDSDAAESDSGDPTTEADRIECPDCDKELEAEARFCSRCGLQLAEASRGDGERSPSECGDEQFHGSEGGPDSNRSEDGESNADDADDRTAKESDSSVPADIRTEATG